GKPAVRVGLGSSECRPRTPMPPSRPSTGSRSAAATCASTKPKTAETAVPAAERVRPNAGKHRIRLRGALIRAPFSFPVSSLPSAARLHPPGRSCRQRILGPGVLGIAPAQFLADLGVAVAPKAGQILGNLHRPPG